jgi:ribosome-associated protein
MAGGDVVLRAAPGLPRGLVIPGDELVERFSRSSGRGGQSVNTADSRVELRWDVTNSAVLSDEQRARLLAGLGPRAVDGTVTVVAAEHRSQLLNRQAARARLAHHVSEALAPPPAARRATRPSRAARVLRVEAKRRRGELKVSRRHPPIE